MKVLTRTFLVSFAATLCIFAMQCYSNEISPYSFCNSWHFGQHDGSPIDQLACLSWFGATEQIRGVSDSDLSNETEYYFQKVASTGDKSVAAMVALLIEEKERRRPPKFQKSTAPYAALLMSGQLKEADEERKNKNLNVSGINLDDFSSTQSTRSKEAAYWTLTDTGPVQEFIDLSRGSRIVVYSSPGCGRCMAASAYIAKNPFLSRVFHERSTWIDIPDQNFGTDFYNSWNDNHPNLIIHAVFDRTNWPERKIAGTPDFFFIKNGKVVSEMLGWTPEAENSIQQKLNAIGLRP